MRIFQNPSIPDYRPVIVRISLQPDKNGYYGVYTPDPMGRCNAPVATVSCPANMIEQKLRTLAGGGPQVPPYRTIGTVPH